MTEGRNEDGGSGKRRSEIEQRIVSLKASLAEVEGERREAAARLKAAHGAFAERPGPDAQKERIEAQTALHTLEATARELVRQLHAREAQLDRLREGGT